MTTLQNNPKQNNSRPQPISLGKGCLGDAICGSRLRARRIGPATRWGKKLTKSAYSENDQSERTSLR